MRGSIGLFLKGDIEELNLVQKSKNAERLVSMANHATNYPFVSNGVVSIKTSMGEIVPIPANVDAIDDVCLNCVGVENDCDTCPLSLIVDNNIF